MIENGFNGLKPGSGQLRLKTQKHRFLLGFGKERPRYYLKVRQSALIARIVSVQKRLQGSALSLSSRRRVD